MSFICGLAPPVESIAHFPDIPHKSLPYAIKQLISHEVEVEKMRREEGPAVSAAAEAAAAAATPTAAGDKKPAVPNHLNQKLKAKAVAIEKEIVPTDFFGRRIEGSKAKAKAAGEGQNSLLSNDVWFKFKEG